MHDPGLVAKTATGVCNKCGYVGECDVEDGALRHYRKDGLRCAYAALPVHKEEKTAGLAEGRAGR